MAIGKRGRLKKILIVDDDKTLADLYCERLEIAGYKPHVLYGSNDVFVNVSKLEPDLILLDFMMPGLSGAQVLEKLKENEETKEIPVIIFTGLQGDQLEKYPIFKKATKYLVKSEILPMDLVKMIDRILKDK